MIYDLFCAGGTKFPLKKNFPPCMEKIVFMYFSIPLTGQK